MIGNTNKAKTMRKSGTVSITDNGLYDVSSYKSGQINVTDKMSDYVADNITEMYLPNNITNLRDYCFFYNTGIKKYYIPGSVKTVGDAALSATVATEITFNEGVEELGWKVLHDNASLVRLYLPSTLRLVSTALTWACRNLLYVTLGNGFNCDNVNFGTSGSTKYSHDTILGWFNALYDRLATTTYTLTIGSTNLAKMSAEDIAIATAKNWTIA